MDDALAVSERERGHDLLPDPQRSVRRDRVATGADRGEAPTPQVPRHDVGAIGFTPVVVQRHDVRVLERRDGLRVVLEPADEPGVAREPRVHDLDGHVAPHLGLERPVHHGARTVVDPFEQSVPAQRLAPQVEVGILPQDPLVQRRQLGRRVDPQLVCEHVARPLERRESVGLPSGAVQRQHQLRPHPLAQVVASEQRLGLTDDPCVLAAREQRVEPVLLGDPAELVQPGGLADQRGLVGQVGEGGAAPQGQGGVQDRDGRRGIGRRRLAGVSQQLVEPVGVELTGSDLEPVSGRPPLEAALAERFAQVRDVGLQGVARRLGRLVAPDLVYQRRGGNGLVRAQEQVSQDGALPRAAERDRSVAVAAEDLQRAEHLEQHRATVHPACCAVGGVPISSCHGPRVAGAA